MSRVILCSSQFVMFFPIAMKYPLEESVVCCNCHKGWLWKTQIPSSADVHSHSCKRLLKTEKAMQAAGRVALLGLEVDIYLLIFKIPSTVPKRGTKHTVQDNVPQNYFYNYYVIYCIYIVYI